MQPWYRGPQAIRDDIGYAKSYSRQQDAVIRGSDPVRGVSWGRGTPSERRKRLRALRWSSYRGYAGLSAPFPFVQETMALDELRGAQASTAIALQAFCREGPVTGGGEPVRSGAVVG